MQIFSKLKRFLNKSVILTVLILALMTGILFADKIYEFVKHTVAYFYVFEGDKKYKKFEMNDKQQNMSNFQNEVVNETYDENTLQEALELYQKALELYPEHVNARYNLGNIYVAYEAYETAAENYLEALNVSPEFYNARINLGIVLDRKLKEIDRGIEEYKKVTESKKKIIKIPFIYNNEYHVLHSKAIAYYNMGLAYRDKAVLKGLTGAGRIYLQRAVESYRKSIEIEPNVYETRYNLAIALHLLNRASESTEEYCRAINLSPLNYDAHYNLAILLNDEGKYHDSVKELEKAGFILDMKGDNSKTTHLYYFMSEVRQKVIFKNESLSLKSPKNSYVKNKNLAEYENSLINQNLKGWQKDKEEYPWLVYKDGKVKFDEKMEKAMFDNFQTCNACKMVEMKKK